MTIALFQFPLKTVCTANQNKGEHWAVKARRVKKEKESTKQYLDMTLLRKKPQITNVTKVTLTRHSAGELDDDNLRSALKAVRDATAQWLGVDDGPKGPKWEYEQQRCKRSEYFVGIAIEWQGLPHAE